MIETFWNNNIMRGLGRAYNYVKYGGFDLESFAKQRESWTLSEEGQAFADTLCLMASAGKITLGAAPLANDDLIRQYPEWTQETTT